MSGNNFVSLPASINCLFKLEILVLEDCKRLQSLPQLPPNVKKVKVNGCASLVTLLGALKLRKSYCTLINCIGSLKLLGNNGLEFSMLREYLKVSLSLRVFQLCCNYARKLSNDMDSLIFYFLVAGSVRSKKFFLHCCSRKRNSQVVHVSE